MPGNASFYISDPSILGSRLFDRLESIISYEGISDDSGAKGFILKMTWGQVNVNLMPSDQLTQHLNGFEGYIKGQVDNEDDLIYILSRLNYVQLCLGCNITHDYELEDEVQAFLFEFNSALNSLMFMYDSVWDWSSEVLCGPHKNG